MKDLLYLQNQLDEYYNAFMDSLFFGTGIIKVQVTKKGKTTIHHVPYSEVMKNVKKMGTRRKNNRPTSGRKQKVQARKQKTKKATKRAK